MKIRLPEKSIELIQNYMNIKMGPYNFACPYFQNKNIKALKSVFLGKGSPNDIQTIAQKIYYKYYPNNVSEAKKILIKNNIGIDCSGLVLQILLSIMQYPKILAPFIIHPLRKNLFSTLRHYFRFFTNVSAATLTSNINSVSVDDINKIQPGDLIRAGKGHVGLITEIIKQKNKLVSFSYIHSISDGVKKVGVSTGKVSVIDLLNQSLVEQKWVEKNQYMLNEYINVPASDRSIRRLKYFRTNHS